MRWSALVRWKWGNPRGKSNYLAETIEKAIIGRTEFHKAQLFRRRVNVPPSPGEASCLRLVRALCVEVHENWIEDHRDLDMSLLKEQKKELLRAAA